MADSPSLIKLRDARDKLAEGYEIEATDSTHDNGNLDLIHKAVGVVEDAIKKIEERDNVG